MGYNYFKNKFSAIVVTKIDIPASYIIMNRQTDQEYVEKTLQGDSRAFGVLVEKHQNYIFTIVFRMLKVREEAEEVSQDAFLKAYEALPGFRGESKFSTWLYRIAYRKALDRLRNNSRKNNSEIIEEITGDLLNQVESGLDGMINKERNEIIRKGILQLPEQEAAIISLYYYDDQSVKEIAQVMEISEDNVKVKLFRSRKLLFSILGKYITEENFFENGKAV